MTRIAGNAVMVAAMSLLWWSVTFQSISAYERATLSSFDTSSYTNFVTDLRNKIPTEGSKAGIKFLKKPPGKGEELVLVELTNGNHQVTLALDSSDLYVSGYQAGTEVYVFKGLRADLKDKIKAQFSKTPKELRFDGSYTELQRPPVGDRGNIQLGLKALKQATQDLAQNPSGTNDTRRALLIIIQMVSEAARFKYIAEEVTRSGSAKPTNKLIDYELDWNNLSKKLRDTPEEKVSEELKKDVYLVKP